MSRYRWVVLFSSFYAFVAFAFALQIVPPLLGTIIDEFGVSHAQAGLSISMVVIPGIFLAIPAGILTDRYGIKLAGSISAALIALGCFITAIASSFNIFLLGRSVLGVGGAFIVTAMPSLIPQWFSPKEMGKAMGIYGTNMPLASVIAFSSSSILMLNYSWRYPFYVSTAMAILNIVTFTLTVKEGPLKHKHEEAADVRQALKSIEIWKVGVVWLLFNASALSFTTWGPKILADFKNMNPLYASFLASLLMLAAIPFVPVFGWISDKIGRRKPLIILGSALMAGALMAIAYASGTPVIVSIAALGVAAALVPPMVMASPPEILGPNLSGTGYGIVAICLNIGIALAPPFIGLLMDATYSQILAFSGMALFSAIGALVAYALKTK